LESCDMNAQGGSFHKAPVTKVVFLSTLATSGIYQLFSNQRLWKIAVVPLPIAQCWRVLPWIFGFGSIVELCFGLLLLFILSRNFEKLYGSRKFAALTAYLLLGSAIGQQVLLEWFKLGSMPAGPYGLIFGLFALYWLEVPPTTRVPLLRLMPVSDKTMNYAIGLQLLWAAQANAGYTAACGALLGLIYKLVPAMQRLRFPAALERFGQKYIAPLLVARPGRAGGYQRAGAGAMGVMQDNDDGLMPAAAAQGHDAGFDHAGHAAALDMQPPDPTAVATLVAMGFADADVRAILPLCANNTAIAATRLLERRAAAAGHGQ